MAIATSSTLTQEFVDQLSSELQLAPNPQYVFANMIGAARDAALNIDADGRQGVDSFKGAMFPMGSIDRMGGAGSGLAKVVMEAGQGPGKVVLVDRPAYLTGTATEASRVLTEGTAITTTAIAPTLGQSTVTIKEYGGPYDTGNTAVAPIAISDFLKRRSKHDLIAYIGNLLRDDRNRFVDKVVGDLLLTTTNQSTQGGTAVGSLTAGAILTEATLATIKRKLLERSIPTFANGRYMLVLGPRHEENLRADANFREVTRYQVNDGPMLSGYLTSFGGFDICISNTIPTVGVGAASAVTGYQGLAFGPQAIGWGVGMDAEARRSANDDFGREDRFVWVAHEGYTLLNAAFVEKLVTT